MAPIPEGVQSVPNAQAIYIKRCPLFLFEPKQAISTANVAD